MYLYKVAGMFSTGCKNQSLRDRVDYKFDYRVQTTKIRIILRVGF